MKDVTILKESVWQWNARERPTDLLAVNKKFRELEKFNVQLKKKKPTQHIHVPVLVAFTVFASDLLFLSHKFLQMQLKSLFVPL